MTEDPMREGQDLDELLRAIPPEEPPAADLRVLVRMRLRKEGLMRPRRPSWAAPAPWAGALAALTVGFLVGHWTGLAPAAHDAATNRRFALLLYEDERFVTGGRSAEEVALLYSAWADSAEVRGDLVLAEELADTIVTVEGGPPGGQVAGTMGDAPTGVFIIRAPGLAAARSLAEGMPHVRLGGTVVIRPVVSRPTRR